MPRGTGEPWWDQRRFGLLVHVSAACVPAWAPIGQYAEWYRAHLDGDASDVLLHPSPMVETVAHHRDRWSHVDDYDEFTRLLTFDEFEPAAWAQLAVDAGMGYTVMVAKHHDGLCWWDAPNTDRTVLREGPQRNVLGEYATACDRAGIAFGCYYSLLDWSDPRYPTCDYVENVVHPHVLDLVGRYGSRMLWGDGHWGGGGSHWRSDELIEAARRIDPHVIVNDRWWSDGPGVRSFEYRLPPTILDVPWEMRRGLGGSFGYNRAERPEHLLSPRSIVALLTEVVAKGGHLLLSVGPDASGRIPELQSSRLRAAGEWVQRHRPLVDRGRPWSTWGDEHARYLVLDDVLHAVDVDGSGRFDAVASAAGAVRSVTRVGRDGGPAAVTFEQSELGLKVAHRSRFEAAPVDDPVDIAVYRIELEPLPPAPIELFPRRSEPPFDLAGVLAGALPGSIVQLGDGVYRGPARVPDGVVVRGLGPARTVIETDDGPIVAVGREARLEHCSIRGGGPRIAWVPKVIVVLDGPGAVMLGCTLDGHVEASAGDCRVTSCALTGVVARGVDHLVVSRSSFTGMSWDCAVEIDGGTGHVVDGCDFRDVLDAVRLTGTIGATVRGNRIAARWWGVRVIDSESTVVAANSVTHTTRAVDVDGGALAEITGNAVTDGDSGCVIQRGAADTTVAGNRWERCRTGLLAWDSGTVRYHDNAIVDVADPDRAITIGP